MRPLFLVLPLLLAPLLLSASAPALTLEIPLGPALEGNLASGTRTAEVDLENRLASVEEVRFALEGSRTTGFFSCGPTVLICLNTLYPEIYLGIDVEASGPFVPIVAWELRPLLTGGLLDSFAVELPAQGVPPTAGPFTVGVGLGGIELPSGLSAETEDPIGSRCPLKDPSVCTVIEEPSLTLTRATLLVTGIPVPEPAAGALLAAGLAAAMAWGRSPRRPAS